MENKKNNLERFNLFMYNFLSVVLPYSTSFPVAILTAKSAKTFLELDPITAGILVFGLEGLGLLCTSLLVDAVVEWIRSKTSKSIVPIILFGTVTFVYVRILISLNVTLKEAIGNTNPALAGVITLLCYIPLLSGVLAGWNKLRIENKNKQQEERDHTESREDKLRREKQETEDKARTEKEQFKLERLKIKTEHGVKNPSQPVSSKAPTTLDKVFLAVFESGSGDWRRINPNLLPEHKQKLANLSPEEMREMERVLGVTYKTVSNWRTNVRQELGLSNDVKLSASQFFAFFLTTNKRFPTPNEITSAGHSSRDTALFISENRDALLKNGMLSGDDIERAIESLKN